MDTLISMQEWVLTYPCIIQTTNLAILSTCLSMDSLGILIHVAIAIPLINLARLCKYFWDLLPMFGIPVYCLFPPVFCQPWFPPLLHLISFSVYGVNISFGYVVFFLCSADIGTGSSVGTSLFGVFLCHELLWLLFLVGVEFIFCCLQILNLLWRFCYSGEILK